MINVLFIYQLRRIIKKDHVDVMNQTHQQAKQYQKPLLEKAGSLAELTQGFAGSVPDEQGGQTKRNPFQG